VNDVWFQLPNKETGAGEDIKEGGHDFLLLSFQDKSYFLKSCFSFFVIINNPMEGLLFFGLTACFAFFFIGFKRMLFDMLF